MYRPERAYIAGVLVHAVSHALSTVHAKASPTNPPPINGEYIVEYIAAERWQGKQLQYSVKWLGYDEWTWEPATHLKGTLALAQWTESKRKGHAFQTYVPHDWAWPREGDIIDVEVEVPEGPSHPIWAPARILVVLIDGRFQARIFLPDGSDEWDDWFCWNEEGTDWRRPSRITCACTTSPAESAVKTINSCDSIKMDASKTPPRACTPAKGTAVRQSSNKRPWSA